MIQQIAQLGRTPLTRRIVAGTLLIGAAITVAILRNDGAQMWFAIATNVLVALVALVLLHFRWKSRERRNLSGNQVQETFE